MILFVSIYAHKRDQAKLKAIENQFATHSIGRFIKVRAKPGRLAKRPSHGIKARN